MLNQRRNPPGASDMADSGKLPVRGPMGDRKKSRGSEMDLDGDPIISELRKLYEGVVDEPLPNELLELLEKLDEAERNR
jgi:hypothetical protein